MADIEPTNHLYKRPLRFNAHEEIATRIADRVLRFKPIAQHDPGAWRKYVIAQIRAALDAARQEGRR